VQQLMPSLCLTQFAQPSCCASGAKVVIGIQRQMTKVDLQAALAQIDRWSREGRVVKVAIAGSVGLTESGWGGVQTDCQTRLRVVYARDADGRQVDEVIDVSRATVSGKSIWDATPLQQEKFGHFDEVIGLALPDGRTILLMCAMQQKSADS
jgi:hypothetical protein